MECNVFWELLCATRHFRESIEWFLNPFCARSGITPMQLRVLLTLHYTGPMTASALARKTGMAGANNSALCKRMAQNGLIYRRRDPEDERRVQVGLLPRGQALVAQFEKELGGMTASVEQKMSREDAQVITAGLNRFSALVAAEKEKRDEQ